MSIIVLAVFLQYHALGVTLTICHSTFAATLAELVAIPSVNPMGRAVERAGILRIPADRLSRTVVCAARIADRATNDRSPARQSHRPARWRRCRRKRGGPLLLFEVHQDTVPVDGMTIEPWTPTVRDGRLYGRGACDVKGGMTAMLAALARLADERPPNRPTVVIACTVNEEHGFTGASGLCRLWSGEPSPLLPRRRMPRSSPSRRSSKSSSLIKASSAGDATPTAAPPTARDPKRATMPSIAWRAVVAALEQYHRQVLADFGSHPLCGRPTLSVGTIAGGISVNTVPDLATIEIDRRLIPGEEPRARIAR